jgi:phosphate transport system substrate-binding protein
MGGSKMILGITMFDDKLDLNNILNRVLLVLLPVLTLQSMPTAAQDNTIPWTDDTISWAGCGITKKAFMSELAGGFEQKTGIKINLEGGGATRGIRGAVSGEVDFGGSCRLNLPLHDSSEYYVKLHPVAWDALVIIVHPSNGLQSVSNEKLKQIYLGEITNWKDIGGSDAPINLYVRQGKISGVGYSLRQYLFQDEEIEFVTSNVLKSSGPLEEAVETDPLALAVTGISSARKREVKFLGFNDKVPTFENIKDGTYDLYRPLFLATGPNPSDMVNQFLDYAKSTEGQDIIRNNQTVPFVDAVHLMSKSLIYGL